MPRAKRTCNTCTAVVPAGTSRCITCDRAADKARRPHGNPYDHQHRTRFRRPVLDRDPICVLCRLAWSTIADHHPRSRQQIIDGGDNPNDPIYGRGLCKPCHDRETARLQPGGWNVRKGGG